MGTASLSQVSTILSVIVLVLVAFGRARGIRVDVVADVVFAVQRGIVASIIVFRKTVAGVLVMIEFMVTTASRFGVFIHLRIFSATAVTGTIFLCRAHLY